MKKPQHPTLPNGEIDYSKVDASNDFRDFPQIYNTVEDIENFIQQRSLDLPVLINLLKLKKEKKLDITPTEEKFYFEALFDYIYDVYRIPTEETYVKVEIWLRYIEDGLIFDGFSGVKRHSYDSTRSLWEMNLSMAKFYKEEGIKSKRKKYDLDEMEKINYFTDIGETNTFYDSKNPNLIESFWIRCDRHTIQPLFKGEEAYARVHVYPERVYMCGCDDSSYTVYTETADEAKEFALYLKCGAPVWNFSVRDAIHPRLEFTN